MYRKCDGSVVVFLVLYVDDILLIGNDVGVLSSVKVWLVTFLGLSFCRITRKECWAYHRLLILIRFLPRFSMQDSKKGFLPFKHGITLSKDQCPKTPD